MSDVTEAMIDWFQQRAGAVTYSMNYRNGPYSYDCSSSVYYSMIYAGIWGGGIGNTESMFTDLPAMGWYEVQGDENGIPAQRGDVFIWGDHGSSAGASGHTGIFVDPDNIIHCNYGYNSITVNNHDYIWSANGSPSCHIFRYSGNEPEAVENVVQSTPITSKPETAEPQKDWFDMASQEDLRAAVRDVLKEQGGYIRGLMNTVIREECKNFFHERSLAGARSALNEPMNREGSINGKRVGGTTSVALETRYAAANAGQAIAAANKGGK